MTTGSSARQAVRAAMLADLDAIVEAFVAGDTAEVAAFGALTSTQLDEARAITRWALKRQLDMWVEDSQITPEDLATLRGIAAARARDGRPIDAILAAWRLGQRRTLRFVRKYDDGRLQADDAWALTRSFLENLDAVTRTIETTYHSTRRQLHGDTAAARRGLLHDLVAGRQTFASTLAARTEQVGVRLSWPSALIVLRCTITDRVIDPAMVAAALRPGSGGDTGGDPGDDTVPTEVEAFAFAEAGDAPRKVSVLVDAMDDYVTAFAPVPSIAALEAVARREGWAGILLVADSPTKVPAAYLAARHAIESAPGWAWQERRILDAWDVGVLLLLAGRSSLAIPDIVTNLQSLASSQHDRLRDALDAYLATGSVPAAAERLAVHTQTMRYRLRRLEETSGRDVRRPWDRFVLQVTRTAQMGGASA